MKPLNEKKAGKKAAGAGAAPKKAKAVAGSVKKSVSKAKSNVVKAGRKKLNKAAKDEVDDLLDRTASNGDTTAATVTVTPSASGKAVAVAASKTKKIKSMVTLNAYNKMEEEPATPVRQSKRISARAAAAAGESSNGHTNGHSDVKMADISVAEEATEAEKPSGGPGFLKKTISRIWGSTTNGTTAYQEVGGDEAPPPPPAENGSAAPAMKDKCVIS